MHFTAGQKQILQGPHSKHAHVPVSVRCGGGGGWCSVDCRSELDLLSDCDESPGLSDLFCLCMQENRLPSVPGRAAESSDVRGIIPTCLHLFGKDSLSAYSMLCMGGR